MTIVEVRPNEPVEGTYPAHRHACERCHGLYMKAGNRECSRIEHDPPGENGIVVFGFCDAVCYRGDRPLRSREGQRVAEGSES